VVNDSEVQLNEEQAPASVGQYPGVHVHIQTPPEPLGDPVDEQPDTPLPLGGTPLTTQLVQESPHEVMPKGTQLGLLLVPPQLW